MPSCRLTPFLFASNGLRDLLAMYRHFLCRLNSEADSITMDTENRHDDVSADDNRLASLAR
ncbi:MAG: hypothetical protein WC378_20535 [Opitutaceae bacterium]